MNKFEKKAMAKRAYRALVKMGGGNVEEQNPRDIRYTPDMMTNYEFELNGMHPSMQPFNPNLPIGREALLFHNTARAKELPKGSEEWRIAKNNATLYPKHLQRPFGPVMSPVEALHQSDARYFGMDRNPITGLAPWEAYKLTGGRRYVPDSIKLDDTPY